MAKQVKTRIHDYTSPNIEALIQERNVLMVTKSDPKRLEAIKKVIDWYNWGIK